MASVGSKLSEYSSSAQLSALLESDKFGIYAADSYLALDGTTDDYTALYNLINTTINGSDAEIWFKDGTCLIGTSITIPSNIKLVFMNGGKLQPQSGVVITGSDSKIEAGLYEILDLSVSSITGIAGTWDIEAVYPEWFGATGDGSTDDSSSLQYAARFTGLSGGILSLQSKTYRIATTISLAASYSPITFKGNGWSYDSGQATRILVDTAINAFSLSNGANGNSFVDINFYGSDVGLKCINGTYGNKTRIYNCLIERFEEGLYFAQGLCEIKDSYIRVCSVIGATIASDSWVDSIEIASCGIGLKITSGGNQVTNILVNSGTSYGIYVVGSAVNNNNFSGLYLGENTTYNFCLEGTSSCRDNIINSIYIQQVGAKIAGGILIDNCDYTSISQAVFYGGGLGSSKKDTNPIKIVDSAYCNLTNITTHDTTYADITLDTVTDTMISNVTVHNHCNTATPVGQEYFIIASGGSRNMYNNIKCVDTRGVTAYNSKGINNSDSFCQAYAYYLSTPESTPDSFGTMQVMQYNSSLNKLTMPDGMLVSTTNSGIYAGSGTPESSVTAYIGAIYLRTDGGAGTSFYVKESGNGTNTGWIAK